MRTLLYCRRPVKPPAGGPSRVGRARLSERAAQRYSCSPRAYQAQVAPWPYPAELEVREVDAAGTVRVEGHRYFVCEALVHQEVALETVGRQVLVRFRHMYVRELDLARRSTLPFIYPVHQLDHLSPMS